MYYIIQLNRWAKTNVIEEPIKVSHEAVSKYFKYYEPFYLSQNTIPQFQEKFIGYGFNRNSQVRI
jgi:N-acetyllactosaminide beta-1,3-N-acetylglucosaminyltransferase